MGPTIAGEWWISTTTYVARLAVDRSRDRHRVKMRGIRMPEEVWQALKAKAAEEGRTTTEVILRLVRRYLDE